MQWRFSGSEFAMAEVGLDKLQCFAVGFGCNATRRPSELWGGPVEKARKTQDWSFGGIFSWNRKYETCPTHFPQYLTFLPSSSRELLHDKKNF